MALVETCQIACTTRGPGSPSPCGTARATASMASHIMSVAVERAMVAGEEVQGADRLRVVWDARRRSGPQRPLERRFERVLGVRVIAGSRGEEGDRASVAGAGDLRPPASGHRWGRPPHGGERPMRRGAGEESRRGRTDLDLAIGGGGGRSARAIAASSSGMSITQVPSSCPFVSGKGRPA